MHSVYASSALLMMLAMITSTTCDLTTVASSSSPTTPVTTTTSTNNSSPANLVALTDSLTQNDQAKVDLVVTPNPTKIPNAEGFNLTAKPQLLHDITTIASTSTMPKDTTATGNKNETMGNKAANTDQKDRKNGASRQGPEFLVTGLIVLMLRAVYA